MLDGILKGVVMADIFEVVDGRVYQSLSHWGLIEIPTKIGVQK